MIQPASFNFAIVFGSAKFKWLSACGAVHGSGGHAVTYTEVKAVHPHLCYTVQLWQNIQSMVSLSSRTEIS